MDLILHIGTEKTGTTSIQNFLKTNIEDLSTQRIFIPKSTMVGCGNQRIIPLICNVESNNSFEDSCVWTMNFKTQSQKIKRISQFKTKFLQECKHAHRLHSICILSSEHFHSKLRSEEDIIALRELLAHTFESITIVLYIRDPIKTAVSLLSTNLKGGGTPSHLIMPSVSNKLGYLCNHAQSINKWMGVFPNAQFVIRRFQNNSLIDGDVVQDFLTSFLPNIDTSDFIFQRHKNESLSLTGMKLMRRLNTLVPAFVDKKPNNRRKNIVDYVLRNTNDASKFVPCSEEALEYESFFANSNEEIRKRYFPADDSLFEKQNIFSNKQIDLSEIDFDPQLVDKLILDLWDINIRIRSKLSG